MKVLGGLTSVSALLPVRTQEYLPSSRDGAKAAPEVTWMLIVLFIASLFFSNPSK